MSPFTTRFLTSLWACGACLTLLTLGAPSAQADHPIGAALHANYEARHAAVCRPHFYGSPDLFYNYYVGSDCGLVGTQMYLAPHPVPEHVGHSWYTYQPFMPHEMLYKHKRVYHRYYNEGRGLTRTSVRHW
jgi:hypothetical protein